MHLPTLSVPAEVMAVGCWSQEPGDQPGETYTMPWGRTGGKAGTAGVRPKSKNPANSKQNVRK